MGSNWNFTIIIRHVHNTTVNVINCSGKFPQSKYNDAYKNHNINNDKINTLTKKHAESFMYLGY